MAGRRGTAFRPSAAAARSNAPSRRQAIALACALLAVAGAVVSASFLVRPSKARSFDLYYGTVYLNDNTAPVAVDLASGKPSVRLSSAYTQVSAKQSGDLDVVPLAAGTLLLDNLTGEFNMVDGSGYVLKPTGGGVKLPATTATTSATGVPAGSSAYIVRTGSAGTSVYLVSQSTVAVAAGGGKARPRANVSFNQPVPGAGTSTVSANGDLWLLAGGQDSRTIRQLSVPNGSNAGATLDIRDHGTVTGVAAVAASTVRPDGTGGDAVAVATASSVRVFGPNGSAHTLAVSPPAGLDRILPATNQRGGFAFMYHGTAGWSLVRAPVGGTGHAGMSAQLAIGSAQLAPPAESNGSLYTLDLGSGALWRISSAGAAEPVPGRERYPMLRGETSDLSSATVLARGTRVIYNSRAMLEALTVFTDGSRDPFVIDKRTAYDLAPNGAAALSDLRRKPPTGPVKEPRRSRPQPDQQITDKIDCATTTQTPHIPTVQLVERGSRSVQIHWDYVLLDRQDCMPSTYTVSVRLVSKNAPPPPATLTVQGSDGVNVTGLFPDTEYRVVVNAYINGKSTPSAPLAVRTSVEGPAAPTSVQAVPDDNGNWAVSWISCGGIQQGCVPAATWNVIPQLCDDAGGLISAPANGTLVGDPTQHSFTLVYKGSPSLLGRGLSFEVAGVAASGTIGAPSGRSSCAFSWAHPIPGNISVAASTPPQTQTQGSSSTTAAVTFTGDPTVALGGAGGQLTYQLLSNGTVVTSVGPTSATKARLPGVLPGQAYQVRVIVTPPRHPEAAVSLPAVDVMPATATWPALSVSVTDYHNTDAAHGLLTLQIQGLSGSTVHERFDLVDGSVLRCGNAAIALSTSDFDPATPLSFPIDRTLVNGDCTATLGLIENATNRTNPPYFGGQPSGTFATPTFQIPAPTLAASGADFAAAFSGTRDQPSVTVTYDNADPLLLTFATDWSMVVSNNGGTTTCGSSTSKPTAVIAVDKSCIQANATFTVAISFSYFGATHSFQISASGAPQPINAAQVSFSAQWLAGLDANGNPSLVLKNTSSAYPDLGPLTDGWSETVKDPSGRACGTDSQVVSSEGVTITADGSCLAPTPSGGWTVVVTFSDRANDNSITKTVTIDGLPPAAPAPSPTS